MQTISEEDARKVHAFRALSDAQLERVRVFVIEHRCHARQVVFAEGEAGDGAHFVLEGSVLVYRTSAEGAASPLARIGVGSVVGEMALVDGGARSATAVAVNECRLGVLRADRFALLVESDPASGFAIAIYLARLLAERLRRTNELIA